MKILRTHSTDEFSNWSGSLRFTPYARLWPSNEAAIGAFVHDAISHSRVVRAMGSGHSSSPLVQTPDMLLSLRDLHGLIAYDTQH
ncbi:MAG: hypothetical protein ABW171_06970, partial [Steroidobacter sp.]